MTPPRQRLPSRRPCATARIGAGGTWAHATVGYDPSSGAPREIFLSPAAGRHGGSALDALCDDVAVLVSVALQHGVPVSALAHSVARLPDGGGPASLVGAALDLLAAEGAQ